MSGTRSTICDAIASRVRLRMSYGGKERVVEPYCHGTDKKGDDVLRAFQVSAPDGATGWRFFKTASIEVIAPTDVTFEDDRPDYVADDKQMRRVHCCI